MLDLSRAGAQHPVHRCVCWQAMEFRGQAGVEQRRMASSHVMGRYDDALAALPDQVPALPKCGHDRSRDQGEIHGEHQVLLPGTNARRMIISDIDDTVIHTGATQLLTITRLTFLSGVHNRRVLEGVAQLYRQLATEGDEREANPLFYVSSSAWNLYDLIERIMTLGIVPRGPLMFQRLGLANNRFVREPGHRHKLAKVEGLLRDYPQLCAILIGDSGQHDARLYADAVKRNPGRILAVYIRDVDEDRGSAHDLAIREALEEVEAAGVPALRFSRSDEMRIHALERGWV